MYFHIYDAEDFFTEEEITLFLHWRCYCLLKKLTSQYVHQHLTG